MYLRIWIFPVTCLPLLFGCALPQQPEAANTTVRTAVKSADGTINGEIVGIPSPGSKFGKLKIGMTIREVENLIGKPDNTDSRITGKQYQPFYFGGDTQRTEAFYKNEGQLTFSNIHPDSAADTLIRIMVNPNSGENR